MAGPVRRWTFTAKRINIVGSEKGMTNHRGISEYKVSVNGSSRRSFLPADINVKKEYFRSKDK